MKRIAVLLSGLAIIFILSGCGSSPKKNSSQEQTNTSQSQNQDTGYIDGKLNIQKQLEQNINNNINQENNKINEAMSETNNDYLKKYNAAEIETNLGKIKVKFYNSDSPITVNNFLKLADQKFYDGTKFHRVIKGFMIQGGDPNSEQGDPATWGTGGPGYTLPAEIKYKNVRGTIATARLGDNVNPEKNSSGSQFYINTVDNTSLDNQYTVFGEVISGMDTVDKIELAKTGMQDRPVEDVVIKSISLLNIQ